MGLHKGWFKSDLSMEKMERIRQIQFQIFQKQREHFPDIGSLSFFDSSESFGDIAAKFESEDAGVDEIQQLVCFSLLIDSCD